MDFMSNFPVRPSHRQPSSKQIEPYWDVPIEPCRFQDSREDKLCMSILFALCSSENDAKIRRIVRMILNHCRVNEPEDASGLYVFLKSFNPFMNAISWNGCQKLVNETKAFLNAISEEKNNLTSSFQELAHNEKVLEDVANRVLQDISFTYALTELYRFLRSISSLLKCQIIVSCEETLVDWKGDSGVDQTYLRSTIRVGNAEMGDVQLFLKDTNTPGVRCLLYGLIEKTGNSLQEKALTLILRMAHIRQHRKISSILCLPSERGNVLVSLFRWGHVDIVRELLKQPWFITERLHRAGFAVSPFCLDFRSIFQVRDQLFPANAFHYGAIHGFDVIFALYHHCVHTWREYKTAQNKDLVMAYLLQVKEVLTVSLKCFQSFEQSLPELRQPITRLKEIIAYHKFQENVFSQLVEVCKTGQFNEVSMKKVQQIMASYELSFHMNESLPRPSHGECECSFDRFKTYRNFFKSLDFHAALLFFDNSHSAKCITRSKEVEFVESRFLKFLFFCFYNDNIPQDIARKLHSRKWDSNNLTRIAYAERQEFYKHVKDFNHRQSASANVRDQSSSPPSGLYTSLIDPAIIDEFLVHRVEHYLNLTLSKDLWKDLDKMSAIFTRALQVIGEVVTFHFPEQPTLMRALLLSALPLEVADDLRQIRISLSHNVLYKGIRVTTSRLDIEKEIKKYYEGMQDDFQKINYSFKHIFELQALRSKLFYLQNAVEALDKDLRSLPSGIKKKSKEYKLEKRCRHEFLRRLIETEGNIKEWVVQNDRELENHFKFLQSQSRMITYDGWKNKTSTSREVTMKQQVHVFSCIYLILQLIDVSKQSVNENQGQSVLDGEMSAIFKKLRELAKEDDVITITKFTENSLKKLCDLKDAVFEKRVVSFSSQSINSNEFSQYKKNSRIHKFRHKIVLHEICSWVRDKVIARKPPKVIAHIEAKTELIKFCESKAQFEDEDDEKITNLKDRLLFKQTDFLDKFREGDVPSMRSIKHSCEMFEEAMKNPECELKKVDFEYASVAFKMDEPEKMELRKLLKCSVHPREEKSLELFCNRVEKLEKYLINDIPEILSLSKKTKDESIERYMREVLVNVYTKQPEMQAVVESLIFDCMNLTGDSREDLVQLCEKTNYLFSGENLRKIMAHGDVLFEAVSSILDPCDLVNEIICKSLELVKDLDILKKMCELRIEKPEEFIFEEDFENNIKVDEFNGMDKYLGLLPSRKQRVKKQKLSSNIGIPEGNLGTSTSKNFDE